MNQKPGMFYGFAWNMKSTKSSSQSGNSRTNTPCVYMCMSFFSQTAWKVFIKPIIVLKIVLELISFVILKRKSALFLSSNWLCVLREHSSHPVYFGISNLKVRVFPFSIMSELVRVFPFSIMGYSNGRNCIWPAGFSESNVLNAAFCSFSLFI